MDIWILFTQYVQHCLGQTKTEGLPQWSMCVYVCVCVRAHFCHQKNQQRPNERWDVLWIECGAAGKENIICVFFYHIDFISIFVFILIFPIF
jgi:hypothetical protein